MTDQELIARAREVARELFAGSSSDRDRLAAGLLRELAGRLGARAPEVAYRAWCKRCHHSTASVPCPRCDGPACAACGQCPDCDGPVPGEEE